MSLARGVSNQAKLATRKSKIFKDFGDFLRFSRFIEIFKDFLRFLKIYRDLLRYIYRFIYRSRDILFQKD